MRINVLQKLVDFEGRPIETAPQACAQCGQPVGKREALTLRIVAINALLSVRPDRHRPGDQQLSGEEKMKRNDLAQRIYTESEPDLSVQEMADIQLLINETYPSPLVVAQAWKMLECKKE